MNDRKALNPLPEWKMPDPPRDMCPDCAGKLEPYAINTGDSWYLCWDCEKACNAEELLESLIDWPFAAEDHAYGSDLERIGFHIE